MAMMARVGSLLALLALLAAPGAADEAAELDALEALAERSLAERAPRWRCEPTAFQLCNASQCEGGAPTAVKLVLDFEREIYSRCDKNGCDDHQMVAVSGGIYTVISVSGQTFLKAANDGSDFVDVASMGTAVFLHFGACRPD